MIQVNKANVAIGGQWGSEGKGKLYCWLYWEYPELTTAICDFAPNAGHTYVGPNPSQGKLSDDIKVTFKMLPMGALFPWVETVYIGPHAVIDLEVLCKEILLVRDLRDDQTWRPTIHPRAAYVVSQDKIAEQSYIAHIASTMQGTSEAMIRKIRRQSADLLMGGVHDHDSMWNCREFAYRGQTVLIETAQGFDLGINCGHRYPYVTSRDCLLGRVLDNASVHPRELGSIIGIVRTYPIRVGDIPEGTSGPWWNDQREIDWNQISGNCHQTVKEYTTVTKRVRRVFTWSNMQFIHFLDKIKPDYLCLNYVNYLSDKEESLFLAHVKRNAMARGCTPKLVGTGAANHEMEDYNSYYNS